MERKHIFAVIVAAAASSAFAESPTVVNDNFVSTRSRAEVQAELQAFKQSGVNPWSMSYNQLTGFRSKLTRQQVVADYLAGRNEVAAVTSEDSGSAYFAQAVPHRIEPTATLARSAGAQ